MPYSGLVVNWILPSDSCSSKIVICEKKKSLARSGKDSDSGWLSTNVTKNVHLKNEIGKGVEMLGFASGLFKRELQRSTTSKLQGGAIAVTADL